MIEVRNCPAEAKMSGAVYGAYVRGTFCKIGSSFATAEVTTLHEGQANVGEAKLVKSIGSGECYVGRLFPIDKLTFQNENAETTYDTLASGDRVIYYTEGTFATDCYVSTLSGEANDVGTMLYVNTTGFLTNSSPGGASDVPIAQIVGWETVGTAEMFNGAALYARNLLVYRML
jgi:hypothetical protein